MQPLGSIWLAQCWELSRLPSMWPGIDSIQEPVFQKSRKFSGLFRVPLFPTPGFYAIKLRNSLWCSKVSFSKRGLQFDNSLLGSENFSELRRNRPLGVLCGLSLLILLIFRFPARKQNLIWFQCVFIWFVGSSIDEQLRLTKYTETWYYDYLIFFKHSGWNLNILLSSPLCWRTSS